MEANRKRVQVHKLPTEDKSNIGINLSDNNIIHTIIAVKYPHQDIVENQHLYFTIDEEIKEGDWFIDLEKGVVIQWTMSYAFPYSDSELHRKIIATTDPKLTIVTGRLKKRVLTKSLPQPSQALIKAYCEQGGFDEVDVEYEEMYPRPNHLLKLKVDPIHNTITTHRIVEKMYSISDIEAYCEKYSNDTELGREIRKLRYKQ